jgi:hypothetical protein
MIVFPAIVNGHPYKVCQEDITVFPHDRRVFVHKCTDPTGWVIVFLDMVIQTGIYRMFLLTLLNFFFLSKVNTLCL